MNKLHRLFLAMNIHPDYKIDDGGTYNYYVRQGLYLNSLIQESSTPQISLFDLRGFASSLRTTTSTIDAQANQLLHRLFDIECNFGWQQFEEFHPIVESLRRVFFPSVTNLANAYPHARRNPDFYPGTISFTSCVDQKNYLPIFLAHKYPSDLPMVELKSKIQITSILNQFFIPAKGNPGFDSFIIQTCRDQKRLALCIENRWSDEGKSTKLTLNDIIAKHKVVAANFSKMGSNFGLPCDRYCLVIVAWRGAEKFTDDKLPPNTLILNKKELFRFYGPTMTIFQQFYMGLDKDSR